MKSFAILLSLIVLVLSIAPCCALNDHIKQVEAGAAHVEQDVPQDEDCCQDCSPFYTCGTCGGFMVTSLISFPTPTPTLISSTFNRMHLQSFADGIDQNIWQPPKLS